MDVLIVWVSDSMLREPRYRIRNLIPALTRAKRMIFFIGRTDHLAVSKNQLFELEISQ